MRELTAKRVLTRRNSFCIYRGCTHRCICCPSRSKISGVKDFTDVGVRINAPEVLAMDLRAKRRKCVVSFSSLSDPYQPLEGELGLARECLEILEAKGFGANILTKSELIERDFDLLAKINHDTKAIFQTSLATMDDELSKILEPGACPTSRRAELIQEAKNLGIPVIVRIKPIIPFINDDAGNLGALIDLALALKVDGILNAGFGVVLKKTSKDFFFDQLDKQFPELVGRYLGNFGPQFTYESPNAEELMEIFHRKTAGKGVLTDPLELESFVHKYQCRAQGKQISFF